MYLVFSDLDGTLLDHDTYNYGDALEGLALLRKRTVPLILVSSKTLPEMEILHREWGLDAPFIFENGGGIFWPCRNGQVEILGIDASELKKSRQILEGALGEPVCFITDMSVEEIMEHTGLSRDRALLARQRLTSLPFILPSGRTIGGADLATYRTGLMESGLSVTKGGRFYHLLSSRSDKGSAIRRVVDHYRRELNAAVTTIGIGDGENDIAMFRAVDIPVAVRRKDGTVVETAMDNIWNTAGIGPRGFSEAIQKTIGADQC